MMNQLAKRKHVEKERKGRAKKHVGPFFCFVDLAFYLVLFAEAPFFAAQYKPKVMQSAPEHGQRLDARWGMGVLEV